jgi:hypothetical protein
MPQGGTAAPLVQGNGIPPAFPGMLNPEVWIGPLGSSLSGGSGGGGDGGGGGSSDGGGMGVGEGQGPAKTPAPHRALTHGAFDAGAAGFDASQRSSMAVGPGGQGRDVFTPQHFPVVPALAAPLSDSGRGGGGGGSSSGGSRSGNAAGQQVGDPPGATRAPGSVLVMGPGVGPGGQPAGVQGPSQGGGGGFAAGGPVDAWYGCYGMPQFSLGGSGGGSGGAGAPAMGMGAPPRLAGGFGPYGHSMFAGPGWYMLPPEALGGAVGGAPGLAGRPGMLLHAPPPGTTLVLSPPAAPHRYQCRFCVYGSNTRSHLEAHERIHTGERPYACKLCPYVTS